MGRRKAGDEDKRTARRRNNGVAKSLMASYLIFWSSDRCESFRKHGQTGQPLTVLFGGPHQSMPRFRSFGVTEGDYLYLVRVTQGVLRIIGRMRVNQLIPIERYAAGNPESGSDGSAAEISFHQWRQMHPEKRYLAWTCTSEAALGEGTAIGLDIAVPGDVLEALRFRSPTGERPLKYVEDGKLKRSISLEGRVSRLTDDSAQMFEELMP